MKSRSLLQQFSGKSAKIQPPRGLAAPLGGVRLRA